MNGTKLANSLLLAIAVVAFPALLSCTGGDGGAMPITTTSDEALDHFLQGRRLQENIRNPEARRHFRRAVKADSEFALAYLYLALTDPSAKGFFENLRLAKNHSTLASEGERLMIEATEASANGDPALQRELVLRLAELYSSDITARLFLANSYFGTQEYELAVAEYEAIVEMSPGFAPPYNMLGYSYRSLDDYEAAAQAFKTYIELIPDDPNPYDSYAELLSRMGRFEEAIAHYRRALEQDPTFGASRLGVAYNLMFLNRHGEAREELAEYYQSAINSGQRRAALAATALVYIDEGDLEHGIEQFQLEYELAREMADPSAMAGDLRNIAFVQLLADRISDAEQSLKESLDIIEESDLFERVKRSARLNNQLSRSIILMVKGELTEARQLATDYLAQSEKLMNPFRIRGAHLVLGRIENAAGNYDAAIAELEQADQEQAWTLFHLAEAYEGSGDLARAKELYDQAAKVYQIGSITYACIRLESEKRVAALDTRLSL